MKSNGDNQKTWTVRGLLTATGEDVPAMGESSVMARVLVLSIKGSGNMDKLTRSQMHCKHLPGVMAKFIQFIINKKLKEDDVFEILANKKKLFSQGGMHPRNVEIFALNSFAWDMFAEFMGCEELSKVYYENLVETRAAAGELTKNEQASNLFLEGICDLLSAGSHYLEGTKGYNSTYHTDHAKKIGWIAGEAVYLLGNIALGEVNMLRTKTTGNTLKYSLGAILDQMAGANQILLTKGKTTHVVKMDGQSARVVKVVRGILESSEKIRDDAESTNSTIRSEEDYAVIN